MRVVGLKPVDAGRQRIVDETPLALVTSRRVD